MTPMIPAVFFYFFDGPEPVRIDTRAKPDEMDDRASATRRLRERRAALVRVEDVAAVLRALEQPEPVE